MRAVVLDDALIGYALEIGERENQLTEELHLLEAGVVEGLVPGLHVAGIAIARGIAGLQHLHDGIMAVGVAATAGKHAPIGITPHVAGLPVGFGLVVQSHGDILVGGLGIEHGFDGFVGPRGVDIHPIVLLGIVGDGVVGIAHALAVSAVTALEGVEIHPGGLAPPFGRGIATSGVIGHQVVMVDGLDTGGEGIPYLGLDVALDVAAHEPDDVGLVLVTVGEEGAVFFGLVDTQFAVLHQSAPDAHHADIDAILPCQVDDVVEVVPVAVRCHTVPVPMCAVPMCDRQRV